jgi:hypothetical protein
MSCAADRERRRDGPDLRISGIMKRLTALLASRVLGDVLGEAPAVVLAAVYGPANPLYLGDAVRHVAGRAHFTERICRRFVRTARCAR